MSHRASFVNSPMDCKVRVMLLEEFLTTNPVTTVSAQEGRTPFLN